MNLINPIGLLSVVCLSVGSADSQSEWTQRLPPFPVKGKLNSVTWSQNRWVGEFDPSSWRDESSRSFLASTDGEGWNSLTVKPEILVQPVMNPTVWTGSQFVSLSGGGTILTSPDSLTWTISRSGASNTLRDLAWTGGQIVVVGNNGTVLTSPDANAWTVRSTGTVAHIVNVRWVDSQLVAVDVQATLLTSKDGIAWASKGPPRELYAQNVDWLGRQLIVFCTEGISLTTTDFKGWVLHQTGIAQPLRAVFRTDSLYLLLGDNGIATSSDGAVWTNPVPLPSYSIKSLTWNEGRFALVSVGEEVLTSVDGANWTLRPKLKPSWNLANFTAVAATDSLLVAIGNAGTMMVSEDGISWKAVDPGTKVNLVSILWTGKKLIVGGDSGTILTSPDGIHWDKHVTDRVEAPGSFLWTGSKYLGFGGELVIFSSEDGKAWSYSITYTGFMALSMTWTGEQFFGIAFSGRNNFIRMAKSTDGVKWITQGSPGGQENKMLSILWTGTQLVAVGMGAIFTSPDGSTWTQRLSDPAIQLYSVVKTGNQLIAVGAGGAILTSPDGDTWTRQPNSVSMFLAGSACKGNVCVAVGDIGTLLSSPFDPSTAAAPVARPRSGAALRVTATHAHLSLPGHHGGTVRGRILTLRGKTVAEFRENPVSGGIAIPIGDLRSGAYRLVVDGPSNASTASFTLFR